jgi:hypothetical protein
VFLGETAPNIAHIVRYEGNLAAARQNRKTAPQNQLLFRTPIDSKQLLESRIMRFAQGVH